MGTINEAISKMKGVADTATQVSRVATNAVSARLPGCCVIPDCLNECYVYFINRPLEGVTYVSGHLLNERVNILEKVSSHEFDYVLFYHKDLKKLGIHPVASGGIHYEEYATMTPGQIASLRLSDKSHTYITCPKDADFLKLRLDTIGVHGMYTAEEINLIIADYLDTAGPGFSVDDLEYQCIIDLALKCVRDI